jgi:hypothetical protein
MEIEVACAKGEARTSDILILTSGHNYTPSTRPSAAFSLCALDFLLAITLVIDHRYWDAQRSTPEWLFLSKN